ncbi:MAG: hypothetical protein IJY78_02300 [Bacteroidaceae bacterium]|nr:hypothetical protein [Bacteroidaceae bacterium]
MQIVSSIFQKVAWALYNGATAIGITYNEINIIVYYLLIPLSWTIMFDCWLGSPITSFALIFIWFGIKIGTWGRFREWSDWAFMRSVDFLNYFNRFGGNYVLNSVVICVLVPIIIYVGLFLLLMQK